MSWNKNLGFLENFENDNVHSLKKDESFRIKLEALTAAANSKSCQINLQKLQNSRKIKEAEYESARGQVDSSLNKISTEPSFVNLLEFFWGGKVTKCDELKNEIKEIEQKEINLIMQQRSQDTDMKKKKKGNQITKLRN